MVSVASWFVNQLDTRSYSREQSVFRRLTSSAGKALFLASLSSMMISIRTGPMRLNASKLIISIFVSLRNIRVKEEEKVKNYPGVYICFLINFSEKSPLIHNSHASGCRHQPVYSGNWNISNWSKRYLCISNIILKCKAFPNILVHICNSLMK